MSDQVHIESDNLPKDLSKIIKESRDQANEVDENALLQQLVMYIVARDHKVFDHAYKLGKESK